ncbi:LysR substrate-binding domain-containing protein [Paraburkholderia solisilvae]|uniref:HTH-type transcriptional regulator HdfR n=1 Tax=Paraburkholderia solisilvae TaxID=624376 RepID=A0A6J5D283_9BURK|nr:LysR substrate-binding domain-containing protein [Paraburkholderia solisilvae]CAB3747501.1 HTH-type transcriptional regulator HdfR [Paraburkholderia solisilvae]
MIRYLRTFVVAAEAESFSAAGNRLGLTQSAVSTQIRRLEDELGFALFDRKAKSVTLCEEGRHALEQAAQILDLFDGMKRQRGFPDRGGLNIGAISTVQASFLPKALQQFRRVQPAASINIAPGVSAELLAKVDSHELDMAVMIKPRLGLPPDLKWIPLISEHYVGIAPKGAPTDLPELLRTHPFIRYDRRSPGGQLVDRYLKQHGLSTMDTMELDEPSVILNMVSEGLGCSIIPGDLVPVKQTRGISVLGLPGGPLVREIGILARLAVLDRPSAQTLVDSLAAQASKISGQTKRRAARASHL